jgi:hypothetical protein
MKTSRRAIVLLLVQAALVLSIAGKYLYERKTCTRLWVRTGQYDPNQPLRGRYLSLQLTLDACSLPHDWEHSRDRIVGSSPPVHADWQWNVRPTVRDGKLIPVLAEGRRWELAQPQDIEELSQNVRTPCGRAILADPVEYFIPDTAKTPFPLIKGQELWVEVTIPPEGPPRPIQLAVSKDGIFTPLHLR